MWGLFTRALTLASSTVRVSVINTSANFMITAVLGTLIFKESLPGLWWLGAAMLVAGSVIIGSRDESAGAGVKSQVEVGAGAGVEPVLDGEGDGVRYRDSGEDEEEVELESIKDAEVEESGDEDAVLK
jgi:hypothetical protein